MSCPCWHGTLIVSTSTTSLVDPEVFLCVRGQEWRVVGFSTQSLSLFARSVPGGSSCIPSHGAFRAAFILVAMAVARDFFLTFSARLAVFMIRCTFRGPAVINQSKLGGFPKAIQLSIHRNSWIGENMLPLLGIPLMIHLMRTFWRISLLGSVLSTLRARRTWDCLMRLSARQSSVTQ